MKTFCLEMRAENRSSCEVAVSFFSFLTKTEKCWQILVQLSNYTCPDLPWGPPIFPYDGYRFFRVGKERPGRDADPSPSSSAVVMKG